MKLGWDYFLVCHSFFRLSHGFAGPPGHLLLTESANPREIRSETNQVNSLGITRYLCGGVSASSQSNQSGKL